MKIISPSIEILAATPNLEQVIERAGRVCWKSEDRVTDTSAAPFIDKIVNQLHHESVIEHAAITVLFVCDRGVSHELVRHRLASFSQESTRYCNYGRDKFGQEITVIKPCFLREGWLANIVWEDACRNAEQAYFEMLEAGATPQEARSVLPNSLKTEIVVTANPREWRHILKLRTAPSAHPQMREIMDTVAAQFAERWPSLFGGTA